MYYKKNKTLILLALIGIGVSLFLLNKPFSGSCVIHCQEDKSLEIRGVILKKALVGKNNRGIKTLFIKTPVETIQYYPGWGTGIDVFAEIGDSIAKEKGSFAIHLFRDGELFISKQVKVSDCEKICSWDK